jgi:hypothetical protein
VREKRALFVPVMAALGSSSINLPRCIENTDTGLLKPHKRDKTNVSKMNPIKTEQDYNQALMRLEKSL